MTKNDQWPKPFICTNLLRPRRCASTHSTLHHAYVLHPERPGIDFVVKPTDPSSMASESRAAVALRFAHTSQSRSAADEDLVRNFSERSDHRKLAEGDLTSDGILV
jgi:hypothetical protein